MKDVSQFSFLLPLPHHLSIIINIALQTGKPMKLADVVAYIEPRETILGTPDAQINELAIDSRKVVKAEHTLFFAVETEKNDGHLYVRSLYQAGVRNFVITKVMNEFAQCVDANFLFVDDSVEALLQ